MTCSEHSVTPASVYYSWLRRADRLVLCVRCLLSFSGGQLGNLNTFNRCQSFLLINRPTTYNRVLAARIWDHGFTNTILKCYVVDSEVSQGKHSDGSSTGADYPPPPEETASALNDVIGKLAKQTSAVSQEVHGTPPANAGSGEASRGGTHTAPHRWPNRHVRCTLYASCL